MENTSTRFDFANNLKWPDGVNVSVFGHPTTPVPPFGNVSLHIPSQDPIKTAAKLLQTDDGIAHENIIKNHKKRFLLQHIDTHGALETSHPQSSTQSFFAFISAKVVSPEEDQPHHDVRQPSGYACVPIKVA